MLVTDLDRDLIMLFLLVLLLFLNQGDADADAAAAADAEMLVQLILERKPHGQHYYQYILISARMLPLRLAKKL